MPLRLIDGAFRRDCRYGRLLNLDLYLVGDLQCRVEIANCSHLSQNTPCRYHLIAGRDSRNKLTVRFCPFLLGTNQQK